MALQPLDLSTVYSQMDKLGQINATQAQNISSAARSHVEKAARQDAEKSQAVQQAAENKDSAKIKADVNQGGGAGQGLIDGGNSGGSDRKGRQAQEIEQVLPKKTYQIRDPKLGRHVDITVE